MKRFFLIPALLLLVLTIGCTCSMRGSATMPAKNPTASPTAMTSPSATPQPTAATVPETVAPVEPTAPEQSMMPDASPSAGATAGN